MASNDRPVPDPKKKIPPSLPPGQARALIIYALMMLAMLWIWQEAFKQVLVRTIPYSEFKSDLRHGEVVECTVRDDEITGKIQPKTVAEHAKPPEGAPPAADETEQKNKAATPVQAATPATPAPKEEKGPKASEEAKKTSAAPATPAEPQAFLFRTVRIEDPDLVKDLD